MDKVTLGPMPYMSVMPSVLVGTTLKGRANYMTAGAATVACMAPPMVCVAINKARVHREGNRGEQNVQPEFPIRRTGGRDRLLRDCLRRTGRQVKDLDFILWQTEDCTYG